MDTWPRARRGQRRPFPRPTNETCAPSEGRSWRDLWPCCQPSWRGGCLIRFTFGEIDRCSASPRCGRGPRLGLPHQGSVWHKLQAGSPGWPVLLGPVGNHLAATQMPGAPGWGWPGTRPRPGSPRAGHPSAGQLEARALPHLASAFSEAHLGGQELVGACGCSGSPPRGPVLGW